MRSAYRCIVIFLCCTFFFVHAVQGDVTGKSRVDVEVSYRDALNAFYATEYERTLDLLEGLPQSRKKSVLEAVVYNAQFKPTRLFEITEKNPPYELYYISFQNRTILKKNILAHQSLRQIKDKTVHEFLTKRAHLFLARYYFRQLQFKNAKEYALRLKLQSDDPYIRSEAILLLIEIESVHRNARAVVALYGELLQDHPEKDSQGVLWNKLQERFQNQLQLEDCFKSPIAYFDYLKALHKGHFYKKVQQHAELFMDRFPTFSRLEDVKFILATTLFYQHKYRRAIELYQQLLRQKLSKKRELQSKFYLAGSFENTGKIKLAMRYYSQVLAGSKKDDVLQSRTYFALGKLYLKQRKEAAFDKLIRQYQIRFPDDPRVDALRWEQSYRFQLLLSPEEGVYAMFQRVVPDPAIRARLWSIYLKMAAVLFPGQENVMLQTMGLVPLNYSTWATAKRLETTTRPEPSQKYEWMYERGLRDLAIEEIDYRLHKSRRIDFKKWYVKAVLMQRKRSYYDMVEALQLLKVRSGQERESLPGYLMPFLYPRPYWHLVKYHAEKYELDPYLLMAIMRSQSQFSSFSKVGNKLGLYRIDPQIIKPFVFRLGDRFTGGKALLDPEKNIKYACFYLSELNEVFGGDWFHTLVSYYEGIDSSKYYLTEKKKERPLFIQQLESLTHKNELQQFLRETMESYMMYYLIYD